jgi:hypothetical protein
MGEVGDVGTGEVKGRLIVRVGVGIGVTAGRVMLRVGVGIGVTVGREGNEEGAGVGEVSSGAGVSDSGGEVGNSDAHLAPQRERAARGGAPSEGRRQ